MNQVQIESHVALWEAIEASRAAKLSERRLAQLKRNEALAAIMTRLEQARRDNAKTYLDDRARREMSQDLS